MRKISTSLAGAVAGLFASLQAFAMAPAPQIPVHSSGCLRLKTGGEAIVSFDSFQSPTGILHLYKLKKTNERDYEITVNPVFHDERTVSTLPELPLQSPSLNKHYRDKLSACFAGVNGTLIGPNQERLTLIVGDRSSGAPRIDVGISDKGSRSNSRLFEETIGCSTLLHESLHWMGLVDEYREIQVYERDESGRYRWVFKSDGSADFTCRALGPEDSLMSSHMRRFDTVFEGYTYGSRIRCECESESCRKRLEGWNVSRYGDRVCPRGSNDHMMEYFDPSSDLHFGIQVTPVDASAIEVTRGIFPRPGVSMLYPAHFRAITAPGCKENELYYRCAMNAYAKDEGSGCPVKRVPAQCGNRNPDWIRK